MERMLERREKDTAQDVVIIDKLDTLAAELQKSADSLEASQFKSKLDKLKLSSQVIKELGQTAINRAGLAAIYNDDGQLQRIGDTPLNKEDIQKAEASLGKIYEVYNLYVGATGNQTLAMLKVKEMFGDSDVPKPKDTKNEKPEGSKGKGNKNKKPVPILITPPRVTPPSTVDPG